MITIIMPQVGQDIPSARIIEWRKAEGERVEAGEVVLVVESEKASFEVEAEQGGTLLKVLHGEDEEVDVFAPLAYIGEPGEPIPEAVEEEAEAEPAQRPSPPPAPKPRQGRMAASPSARRIARERGVDLSTVTGSGPGGRIIKRDVVGAPAQVAEGDTVEPFGRMRRRIAERLSLSARTVPHFYLSMDVDMTDALAWRREFNDSANAHVTVTDLVIRAAALALRDFERLNAHVDADRMVIKARVNIGVAVGTGDGLLVPVIADADRLDLPRIAELNRRNAEAALRGALRSGAVGTFTITSMGMFGVREFRPIINPPECAILAVGAAHKCLVPTHDGPAARDVMTLTLGCDHRAVDGAYAAQFLGRVKESLENPATLAAEKER